MPACIIAHQLQFQELETPNMFGCIYACIQCYFYTIMAGTGNALDAGKDAASITCNNLAAPNTCI